MYLVTGARGNIGGAVVYSLEARGLPVRVLSRAPQAPTPGEVAVGDLNQPASIRPALSGVDAIFLLPGYADMDGLVNEIRAAGVKQIVLLSGSSASSGDMSNAITRYMVDSERAVTGSGLDWTVVRPSAFMSNALRWLPQLGDDDNVEEPFPNAPAAVIDPADIGEVVAEVITTPGAHSGRTYPGVRFVRIHREEKR